MKGLVSCYTQLIVIPRFCHSYFLLSVVFLVSCTFPFVYQIKQLGMQLKNLSHGRGKWKHSFDSLVLSTFLAVFPPRRLHLSHFSTGQGHKDFVSWTRLSSLLNTRLCFKWSAIHSYGVFARSALHLCQRDFRIQQLGSWILWGWPQNASASARNIFPRCKVQGSIP